MKCRECSGCYKGYFASQPESYVCISVREPFVIDNINAECPEYPEKRRQLKLCPFCGCEAEYREHGGWWAVHCTNCLAQIGDDGWSKQEITNMWNRRTIQND